MSLTAEERQALDEFLDNLKKFQDDPITKVFPFVNNELDLIGMNPRIFERNHGSSQRPDISYYGSLLRQIRTAIWALLFDDKYHAIEAAHSYVKEKGNLGIVYLYNDKRIQTALTLPNGFRLRYHY